MNPLAPELTLQPAIAKLILPDESRLPSRGRPAQWNRGAGVPRVSPACPPRLKESSMQRHLAASLFSLVATVALCLLPMAAQEKSGTQIIATFKGHTEPVYSVAFTPDGKYLATGSFDNTIKLWEVASGKEAKTYGGRPEHQKMVM